jgi:hypothetical protein
MTPLFTFIQMALSLRLSRFLAGLSLLKSSEDFRYCVRVTRQRDAAKDVDGIICLVDRDYLTGIYCNAIGYDV